MSKRFGNWFNKLPSPIPVTFATLLLVWVGYLIRPIGTEAQARRPATPVEIVATHPFQVELCVIRGPGNCGDSGPETFQVAPTVQMVIEYVSGRCAYNNVGFRLQLRTTAGGNQADHTLHLQQSVIVPDVGEFTQLTRIYADPGSTVTLLTPAFPQGAAFVICLATISGYTVES